MGTLVKICMSPYSPNLQVYEDIVIKVHVPYSSDSVTIKVNPNVQHYQSDQDTADTQIRHVLATSDTGETVTVKFDLVANPVQTVAVAEKKYEMKLTAIEKESLHGQNFPCFKFDVTTT
jgi:hypothetical protein